MYSTEMLFVKHQKNLPKVFVLCTFVSKLKKLVFKTFESDLKNIPKIKNVICNSNCNKHITCITFILIFATVIPLKLFTINYVNVAAPKKSPNGLAAATPTAAIPTKLPAAPVI